MTEVTGMLFRRKKLAYIYVGARVFGEKKCEIKNINDIYIYIVGSRLHTLPH